VIIKVSENNRHFFNFTGLKTC